MSDFITTRLRTPLFIAYLLLITYLTLAAAWNWPGGVLLTQLTTLVQWAFAVSHAALLLGWLNTLAFVGISFVVSLAFEAVGVATGVVYGPYHYTDLLGATFLGVPLLIPLAWFMMIYPSFVLARVLLSESWLAPPRRFWSLALLSAMLMTAWDVGLDPIMVGNGFWVWEVPGPYFGVPIRNFVGWMVTTLSVYLLYLAFARRYPPRLPGRVDVKWLLQPLVVYAAAGGTLALRALLSPNPSEVSQALGLIAVFTMGPAVFAGIFRLLGEQRAA